MGSRNPLAAAMLSWSADFQAGRVADAHVPPATLASGEHLAVRIAPVCEVGLTIEVDGPVVNEVCGTGVLIATDRRVLCGHDDGSNTEWYWARDVDSVTALRDGLGACWSPSAERYASGVHHLEGLVIPALAAGRSLPPTETRPGFVDWVKVQVAWRASQPGGVDLWRNEFRRRYRV